jgi:hypothetical protein
LGERFHDPRRHDWTDPRGHSPVNSANFGECQSINRHRAGRSPTGFASPRAVRRDSVCERECMPTRFPICRLYLRRREPFVFGSQSGIHCCLLSRRCSAICACGATCSMGWSRLRPAGRAAAAKC